MTKGIQYLKNPNGEGWFRINLDTLRMEKLESLPFAPPSPPKPERKIHYSSLSVTKIMEEDRTLNGMRKLKGKLSEDEYNAMWHSYHQMKAGKPPETGEGE